MPQDKDIKRLVRARMAKTGERYTQAKSAIDTRQQRADSPYAHWIEQLASQETRWRAYEQLRSLPPDVLNPLAVAGTTHTNAEIRRRCCRLLDDLAFTPDSFAALERCLDDPEPKVRRAALHSLSCQRCKPEGCEVDVRSVYERMASDPSSEIRDKVVRAISWGPFNQAWEVELVRRAARNDRSARVRATAQSGLDDREQRLRSDAERRQLPPELVAKTERHQGKRVAISGGRIVGVNLSNRAARHYPDLKVYWVEPHG